MSSVAREIGGAPFGALRPLAAAEKLAALLLDEANWRKKVERIEGQLVSLQSDLQCLSDKIDQATGPLIQKCRDIDDKIHRAFEELLGEPCALGKRAKQKVRCLYLELQECGTLSDRRPEPESGPLFEDVFGHSPFGEFRPTEDEPCAPVEHKGRDRQASRDLFRKLAEHLHPDKAHGEQDDDERQRRDEAMKEATIAYREGDISRLMGIERDWLIGKRVSPSQTCGDAEARCEAMQARIADLRKKERELRGSLRHLRGCRESDLLRDMKQFGEPRVMEELTAGLKAEGAELLQAFGFVDDFRHKRINLDLFLCALTPPEDELDGEAMDPMEMLLAMEDLMDAMAQSTRRPKKPKPAAKRRR